VIRPLWIVRERSSDDGTAGVHVAEAPYARDSIAISGGTHVPRAWRVLKRDSFSSRSGGNAGHGYAAIPTGATVADLCAAPGGKALDFPARRNRSRSDKSFTRLQRLLANQRRSRAESSCRSLETRATRRFGPSDVVLIDVLALEREPSAVIPMRAGHQGVDIAVMSALQKTILRAPRAR